MIKSKKGIIRILEAVIAILIIIGVVLVIAVNKPADTSVDFVGKLNDLLDEVAKNKTLRDDIILNGVGAEGAVSDFLSDRIGPGFQYEVKICSPNKICALTSFPGDVGTDVFSAERIISASLAKKNYYPQKVKVFLWRG